MLHSLESKMKVKFSGITVNCELIVIGLFRSIDRKGRRGGSGGQRVGWRKWGGLFWFAETWFIQMSNGVLINGSVVSWL